MTTLDSIDRRLLAELQAEGRVTNVDLARRVGLTAPPCLRRVRALEEEGVIFVKDKVDMKKYGWKGPGEAEEPRQETLF